MKSQIALIFALGIEILLLILIFLVMMLGVLGFFLPFLPGLFLIGAGAALYSLLAKGGKGRITPFIDRLVTAYTNRLYRLPLIQKTMASFAAFKQRKKKGMYEVILSHGLLLCGYNIVLALGFLFGLTVVSIITGWLTSSQTTMALLSMLVIFIFSASSAVVWYRFGQLLGEHLRVRRVTGASLTVLISLLPLLALLIVFAGAVGYAGGFANEFVVIAFLGLLLMSILSSTFELLIVVAGVLTKTK